MNELIQIIKSKVKRNDFDSLLTYNPEVKRTLNKMGFESVSVPEVMEYKGFVDKGLIWDDSKDKGHVTKEVLQNMVDSKK